MRRLLVRMLPVLGLALIALVGAGCSKRHRISIESNVCWIAVIDRQTGAVTNECGNQNFRVAGDIHCVAVTNLSDTGFVRVRLDDGTWAESTAPRGTAQSCR